MVAYYHRVWAALLFGWMSLYMVRVAMSPLLVPLMKEFHLSYAQAGFLSSAVFWAYTLMQTPSGYMGDRWGRRRFLLLGTFSWSVLSLLTGLVTGFTSLFLLRLLTGMAEGTYFGNDRPVIAACTPAEKMAQGLGISAVGMGLGMGFGILMAGQIAEWWGWRSVFFIYSIPSFLAFFFVWKIVKDPEPASAGSGVTISHFSIALRNRYLWLLYLTGFAVMYMLWVLGTWSPAIFLELGVTGVGSSGIYAAVLGFIAVPSLIISGALSDKMKKKGQDRHYHLLVCLIVLTLLAFLMGLGLDLHFGLAWFVVVFVLGGFGVWGFFPPLYALIADKVPGGILGTTFGAANTVGFLASLVAPWCSGYLRDQTQSFSWGFYIAALVLFIGFVCAAAALRSAKGFLVAG